MRALFIAALIGPLVIGGAHAQELTGTGGTTMFHPQGPTVWELLVQALSSTEQGYDLLAPNAAVSARFTNYWTTALRRAFTAS